MPLSGYDNYIINTYGSLGTNVLQHYYPLSEANGASTAVDAYGSQSGTNSGVTAGATGILPTSDGATAYTFAAGNFINLTNPFPLGTSSKFTVEMWIKFSSTTNFQALYQNGIDAHGNSGSLNGSNLAISIDNSSGFTGGISITSGTVYHVVFQYDGTNRKIYVNGVNRLSGTATAGSTPTTNNYIGRWANTGDGGSFIGTMQKVAYYNDALSSTQITNNYNAGLNGPPVTNLTLGGSAGAFSLTGGNAGLAINDIIPANAGNFALAGGAAGFAVNTPLPGNSGNFALAGGAAGFAFSGQAPITSLGSMEVGADTISNLLPGNAALVIGPFQTTERDQIRVKVHAQSSAPIRLNYEFSTDKGTTWYVGQQIPSVSVGSDDAAGYTNQAHAQFDVGYWWRVSVYNPGPSTANVAVSWRLHSF